MNKTKTAVRNPLCDNSTWINTFVTKKVNTHVVTKQKARSMHVNYLTANERQQMCSFFKCNTYQLIGDNK